MLEKTRKSLKAGWRQKAVIPSALQDLETILEEHRQSPRLLPMAPEKSGQLGRSFLSARHHHALVAPCTRRMQEDAHVQLGNAEILNFSLNFFSLLRNEPVCLRPSLGSHSFILKQGGEAQGGKAEDEH